MSYCRFGTRGSDVYVYHGCGFWAIHVAHGIGSQYAGNYMICRTRKSTFNKLLTLKKRGVRVPKPALDRLKREIELLTPKQKARR